MKDEPSADFVALLPLIIVPASALSRCLPLPSGAITQATAMIALAGLVAALGSLFFAASVRSAKAYSLSSSSIPTPSSTWRFSSVAAAFVLLFGL